MSKPSLKGNRRAFLGAFAMGATAPLAGAENPAVRSRQAARLRAIAAQRQANRAPAIHVSNGDEDAIAGRVANFSKGMPHNQLGEVLPTAYDSLLRAVHSGKSSDFAEIARGSGKRLVNPQAGLAFHLEGADPQQIGCPPAPTMSSAAAAAEMVELYWQAHCRDVPFAEYHSSPVTAMAVEELSRTEGFAGPPVSAATLFRGTTPGDLKGPYVSQFLLKPVPYLSGFLDQRWRVPSAATAYMTDYSEWLAIQTGVPPWRIPVWDPEKRYVRNGRDLAEVVHYDFLYQHVLHAALILLDERPEQALRDDKDYYSETNPYKRSKVQCGFVTFGQAQVTDWLARVMTAALKATWCQKWLVHRRLRPEAYGGRLHLHVTGRKDYPLHPNVLSSKAIQQNYSTYGTYLLPQAYPEGCPLHPAYPAGHATAVAAGITVLKALFDEDEIVADCVLPSADGRELQPYTESTLTVGDELNKLAYNIAMGRSFAGIHYRSDSVAGLQIGEEVAISVLQDLALTVPEDFGQFQFRKLDGSLCTITQSGDGSLFAPTRGSRTPVGR